MPLTKAKGNMYDWCDYTHTHLRGECPHRCTYCYVQAMERRFGGGHYAGALRLKDDEFKVKYGSGRTIFIEHCNDLFADRVQVEWVCDILSHCRDYPCNTYVFQTKNPIAYFDYIDQMPDNRILGCTVESNRDLTVKAVSIGAPPVTSRIVAMKALRERGERIFVTIEPIMAFDPYILGTSIATMQPEFVNIGADSKGTGLNEPTGDEVRQLLFILRRTGIEIRAKSNLGRLIAQGEESA